MKLRAKIDTRPSLGATTIASLIALAITHSVAGFNAQVVAEQRTSNETYPVCIKAFPVE